MNTFLQSFLIGLVLAAPIGPSNLTCIRTTLERGLRSGLWASTGVGLGIALYAALPALGFSALTGFVQDHLGALQLLGGAVLLWRAVSTLRTSTFVAPETIQTQSRSRGSRALLAGLTITLVNPIALLAFSALLPTVLTTGDLSGFVLGVSSSVALVMVLYCLLATGLRQALTSPRAMRSVQGLSGLALAVFGLTALFQGSRAVWS